MDKYYVYVYYDPRKTPAEPIYVGKGYGNRRFHHLNSATNRHLANKIKKIAAAGLTPLIEFAQYDISEDAALSLEIDLIAKYGRADKKLGTLCNWTDGGQGTSGYKHKAETIKLFSEQRRGKKQTEKQYAANCNRKPISEATRQKMSQANKGRRCHTPEQIEAIKESNRTRVVSDATRKKYSKTRLWNTPTKAQYPPLNELVAEVERDGISQVAKRLGIGYSSVSKYLRRRGVELPDKRYKQ